MSNILVNILALATVLVIGLLFYLLLSPEMKMKIKDAIVQVDPYDDMIQKCISDCWKMMEQINDASSRAEIEAWYWEAESFETSYRNLVPDDFLIERVEMLYEAVAKRRDVINGIVAA